MIKNDEQLAVVREQLALVEHALEDLRHDILPKNKGNFEVFSEAYVDQIAQLKADIDSYVAAKQKQAAGRKPKQAVRKRQRM
jgi:hypothetical protein